MSTETPAERGGHAERENGKLFFNLDGDRAFDVLMNYYKEYKSGGVRSLKSHLPTLRHWLRAEAALLNPGGEKVHVDTSKKTLLFWLAEMARAAEEPVGKASELSEALEQASERA